MNKNIFAVFGTLVFLLVLSHTARACICAYSDEKSIYPIYSKMDAVFIGKVSEISEIKEASVGYPFNFDSDGRMKSGKLTKYTNKVQKITFDVSETFKGETQKTFKLTAWAGASCGIWFTEGEDYLVFVYKKQPRLTKEELAQPKERWTPETRLKAEADADNLNEQVPSYETGPCLRTGTLEYRKDELEEIRNFKKNGKWKKSGKD